MPGEPVRAKECWLGTCRDGRRRRRHTRDECDLQALRAAASRREPPSGAPTNKAACSCPALFPAGPPRTRGLQKACPPARFGSSILSARELRKSLRFPWFHLLSTTTALMARGAPQPRSRTC